MPFSFEITSDTPRLSSYKNIKTISGTECREMLSIEIAWVMSHAGVYKRPPCGSYRNG